MVSSNICHQVHNGGYHVGSCMGAAMFANCLGLQGVCQLSIGAPEGLSSSPSSVTTTMTKMTMA